MDVLENVKNLAEDPVKSDLAIVDRDLAEPGTRAEIIHSILKENPTNLQRPEHPLLIDSYEIDVLQREAHIGQDMKALTAHPRK
jgi:hypothetical protein